MKTFVMIIAVCLILIVGSTFLHAQEKYPSRGIELVIGWAPGGPADIAGRIFANELTKVLKVPVTPVNKAGASGTIGATYTFKAKKDGYTLMAGSLGWLLGSITLEDIAYDPLHDFVPITKIAISPHGLFVKSDSPFKTLEDFIEKAKKNPRMISCGTAGASSDGHFNIETLQKAAGIEIKHVPFKGGGELPPALLGGHIDIGISVASSVFAFAKAGTMRILAVTGENRMKDLPDVPTLKEKGFKQTFFVNWVGLFTPSGVPPAVISTLSEASEKVVKSKEYIERIEKTGSLVDFMTPMEYQKMFEEEKKATEAIALELGLKKGKK